MRGHYILDQCCGSCKDANNASECARCNVGRRNNLSAVMDVIKRESEILAAKDNDDSV